MLPLLRESPLQVLPLLRSHLHGLPLLRGSHHRGFLYCGISHRGFLYYGNPQYKGFLYRGIPTIGASSTVEPPTEASSTVGTPLQVLPLLRNTLEGLPLLRKPLQVLPLLRESLIDKLSTSCLLESIKSTGLNHQILFLVPRIEKNIGGWKMLLRDERRLSAFRDSPKVMKCFKNIRRKNRGNWWKEMELHGRFLQESEIVGAVRTEIYSQVFLSEISNRSAPTPLQPRRKR